MTRSGVRDQPDQHGETLFLLKIQKLAGHGGAHLYSQLLGSLRQENHLNSGGGGCSELRLCHCTLAWVTGQDSVSKKKKNSIMPDMLKLLFIEINLKLHENMGYDIERSFTICTMDKV